MLGRRLGHGAAEEVMGDEMAIDLFQISLGSHSEGLLPFFQTTNQSSLPKGWSRWRRPSV